MRKITSIVLLFSMALLIAACGNLDRFITITNQSDSSVEKEVVDSVEIDGDVESDEIVDEEEMAEASPTDLEGVLKQMKKASQSVKSAVITGTTTSQNTTYGVTSTDKSVLESKIYLDPFIQYSSIATTSDDGNRTDEMYITDDAMYIYSPESEEWMVIDAFPKGVAMTLFEESYFDHMINVKDYFTLSENDEYFFITYNGPEESYREIVAGSSIEMDALDEAGEVFSEIEEDIVMTGTLELTVSKDTFTIIEFKSTTSTTHLKIDMHSTDDSHYKYSDYNTVDSFDVPDEIKNNAKKFSY